MAANSCRQNFSEDCEKALNDQINLELYASHVYLTISSFFDRDDVALGGFHKYFLAMSGEERGHAEKLIQYQNLRGGRVALGGVQQAPAEANSWTLKVRALQFALELQKRVNQSLLALHALVGGKNDPQFCDFLETEYLKEQVEAIKELADKITNLQRVGEGLGTYLFDKELKS